MKLRLEDYIAAHALASPHKTAVICGEESITYGQLFDKIQAEAKRLGQGSQRALVVRASRSIDFVISYFASHLAGKAFVPLQADVKEDRLCEVDAFVTAAKVPKDVIDILFTTGTTGFQKGTMLSNRAVMANAENLVVAQKFTHDLTFLINGPLNHIGSLSKIWPTIMVGATIKIVEGTKDLNAFISAIKSSSTKVATFLVPAAIRMLLQFGRNELETLRNKIDFIETGAAPISQSDMETLCEALPGSRLYNTYASTETGIIATHDFNHDGCVAGCLGRVMKHSLLNIGQDGLINCSGATIMSGYVGDDALTAQVLRQGIVYTQDKGILDEEGRLHLSGREGDIINIGGYKINPVEVEGVAKSFPGLEDCVCISAPHPVLGHALKLLVVMEPGCPFDRRALGLHMLERLEKHKVPQRYAQVEKIERTYNGKLNRKFYKQS